MNKERMYQEFMDLVTTDSASGKEEAIAQKLMPKLEELGFTVSRDNAGDLFGGECGNVIGIREGELDGAILLSSHMDRVPNGFGIKPVEKDGIVYSDGTTILAADDLSGVVAILEGVRGALAAGKPLPRIEIVFSVGEELNLWGAKGMDVSMLKSRIGYMFDSPGRTGRVINGAPGRYDLDVEIFGKPAHAGNEPEKGIDAAKIMCDMISTLKQGRLDFESTANFPILKTGSTARNVVCDYAMFQGETRSRSRQKLLDYVAYFEDHCKKVAEAAGAEIKITKYEGFLPFLIPEDDEVMVVVKKACEAVGIECKVEVGGGGMDANIYNAKGMFTVGVATGYSKNHTKNEQLILEDYYKSGELAQKIIETYAERCESK